MSQSRVLLVEDNTDNFELVRFLLERAGYQVLEAHNGQMDWILRVRNCPTWS